MLGKSLPTCDFDGVACDSDDWLASDSQVDLLAGTHHSRGGALFGGFMSGQGAMFGGAGKVGCDARWKGVGAAYDTYEEEEEEEGRVAHHDRQLSRGARVWEG